MTTSSETFYYVEGKDFGYCVPGSDLLVGDLSLITTGSEVKFKYGKTTYSGTVMDSSVNESDILNAIKEKQKADKKRKRPSESFHDERPRKAALKQKEKMTEMATSKGRTDKKRAKEARELKKLKDQSSTKTELELLTATSCPSKVSEDNGSKKSEASLDSDNDSDSSAEGSSHSSGSSVSAQSKKSMKVHNDIDASILNTLKNGGGEHSKGATNSQKDVQRDEPKKTKDKTEEKRSDSKMKESERKKSADKNKEHSEKLSEKKKKVGSQGQKSEKSSAKPSEKKKKEKTEDHGTESKTQDNGKESKTQDHGKERKTQDYERESKTEAEQSDSEDEKRKSDSGDDKKSESEDDSEQGKSDAQTASDEDDEPKVKKAKKSGGVKRNTEIFPGQNFRYRKTDKGVSQLHDDFEVYVKARDLDQAKRAKTQSQYCRNLLDKVFTLEALKGSTLLGYPPRGKGVGAYSKTSLPPRLHPDGVDAIIASCLKLEETNKKWRPKTTESTLTSRLAGRLWELSRD